MTQCRKFIALIKGYNKWLFIVMVFCTSLVTPYTAVSAELKIENELLLELRLDGKKLGLDILGYQRGNDFLISLEELLTGLEFPISVNSTQGQANGWYISQNRGFTLDMKRGVVISNGKTLPLGKTEAVIFEGTLFVETNVIQRWFPLQLSANVRQLYLDIKPTELLPLQARQQRKQLKSSRSSNLQEPQYPLQANPYQFLGPHITKARLGYATERQTLDSNASYDLNYALLSQGDLAWMTSTISLVGKSDDALTGANLKLERTAFKGPLLLNHVEVGDLGINGFRGVLLRGGDVNRALNGRFANETVYLEGSQLPDWDVELYQNGQLIATQTTGQDSRYRFEDISLLFGENDFELKFYGPFGEVESRHEYHFLGANMLAPGRLSYDMSMTQEGRTIFGINDTLVGEDLGSGHFTADFNLGLSRNFTIGAGVNSQQRSGERVISSNLGFGLATSRFYVSTRYNYEPNSQDSINSSLRTRIGNSGLNLSYIQFIDDDELTNSPNKWQANLVITSSLLNVPLNLNVNIQEQRENTLLTADLGTTIPLAGSGRFSTSISYVDEEDRSNANTTTISQTIGQSSFYTIIRPWTFRFGSSYALQPQSELIEYSAFSSLRMDRDTTLNLDIRKNELNDLTYYQGGLNWQFDSVQINARVSYNSDERWASFITLSTNFIHKPGRLLPKLDSRASVGMGTVEVQVFSEFENAPYKNVKVKGIQAWRKATTDKAGKAYLTRIPAYRQIDIELDESSITDNELRSTNRGVSVITRPGSYAIVKFPLIRTAELEGYIFIANGKGKLPLSRVLVTLKTLDGELVTQRRSAFDGFFLFDGIEPGIYKISIDDAYANRLIKKPDSVKVSSNSGIIRALNFTLKPTAARGIIRDRPSSVFSIEATPTKGIIPKGRSPVKISPLQP